MKKLNAGNNKSGKYKVKAIYNSANYEKESKLGHLLKIYYLVFWKSYPAEKNTYEPILAIQHLKKLISLFHQDHSDKPTAIFKSINIALLMARPTIKLAAKSIVRSMTLK